jgi:8-oxo-dGTP pyrophosphatase MutT (NUDIX family)
MRWQRQLAVVREALADPIAPTAEELLIMRGLDGALTRLMQPPEGVVPREAAALLLLFPLDDELHLPLTVRSSRLTTHRGEVSLPGGGIEPDDSDETAAALREAEEEIGITARQVTVLGRLSPFYIAPSNNRLTPVVGACLQTPQISADPHEVESVFTVPLRALFDRHNIQEEIWERRGLQMRIPFFALNGYKVWGATALLLSELTARMRRCGDID